MLDSPDTTLPVVPVLGAVPRGSSRARLPLLAFVADEETAAALRGGFVNAVEGAEIRRGTIVNAIRHLAKQATPRALVVDISGVANPLNELEELAGVCTPDVIVLVVGEYNEVGLYRRLVRTMGVAEYIHKPLTRDRVVRHFVPHVMGVQPDNSVSHNGSVIAVCGARGGVGTTTVAVNLALQLALVTHAHVALLDLHLRQGTTALMLGVKPVGGLRIALEQPERADALFLDRVSVEINERLRLIAADEPLDSMPSATPEGARGVLDLLRRRFNDIVVDVPMPGTPADVQVVRGARHLLVIMTPDLASVRDAVRLREQAEALGVSNISIVLNRHGVPGGLRLPLIEQGLGCKPTIVIPELGKQLARAANLGKPALGECAPFRKALALLAQEVTGTPANQATSRSFLSRMLSR